MSAGPVHSAGQNDRYGSLWPDRIADCLFMVFLVVLLWGVS